MALGGLLIAKAAVSDILKQANSSASDQRTRRGRCRRLGRGRDSLADGQSSRRARRTGPSQWRLIVSWQRTRLPQLPAKGTWSVAPTALTPSVLSSKRSVVSVDAVSRYFQPNREVFRDHCDQRVPMNGIAWPYGYRFFERGRRICLVAGRVQSFSGPGRRPRNHLAMASRPRSPDAKSNLPEYSGKRRNVTQVTPHPFSRRVDNMSEVAGFWQAGRSRLPLRVPIPLWGAP